MGHKPSRPVVTFAAAMEALETQHGISASQIEQVFLRLGRESMEGQPSWNHAGATSIPKDLRVSQVAFEAHVITEELSQVFSELGPGASARLFQTLGFISSGAVSNGSGGSSSNSSSSNSSVKSAATNSSRNSNLGLRASVSYEAFVCSTYLLSCARKEERLRLLFNMFDLNSSGFIKKKEFRAMNFELVEGAAAPHLCPHGEPQQASSSPSPGDTELNGSLERDFRPLDRMMNDSGMQLYDTNKDGKLNFDEWCAFAREDITIARCLHAMTQEVKPLFELKGAK